MEADIKTIIFLFIFILIGVVLFQPIYTEIVYITTSGTYTTITSGTVTESSFVPNPNYVGASNVTIVSLVPIFYLLVLIVVPAIIVYRMWRSND